MFIMQVVFEGESSEGDKLLAIIKAKNANAQSAPGCISSECWKTEGTKTAGYCLVSKWADKEDFQAWMRTSHAAQRHSPEAQSLKSIFTKKVCQFSSVELEQN
jgi:heme-degrading monooxygenase HmoA